jgi:hypothetical protein
MVALARLAIAACIQCAGQWYGLLKKIVHRLLLHGSGLENAEVFEAGAQRKHELVANRGYPNIRHVQVKLLDSNHRIAKTRARIEHVFAGLAQMGRQDAALHWPGTRKAALELEGRGLQLAVSRLSEGGPGRGILMPEVRLDRRKRASTPEKEIGKRRRSRVAGHIQTLGSQMTAKSPVIRGAQ